MLSLVHARLDPTLTLGQASGSTQVTQTVVLLGVMIAVVMLAGITVLWIRARALRGDASGEGLGSVMEELRRLRWEGQLSEDEYDRARKKLAARAASRPAPSSADPAVSPNAARPLAPRRTPQTPPTPPAPRRSPPDPRQDRR